MTDEAPRSVHLGADGSRATTEHGVTSPDPVQPTELVVQPSRAPAKVTKTQARAAVNMKIAGAGYDEIAAFFDYVDAATARKVVEETLANAFPDESIDALRRITQARMEGLMKKIAAKVEPTVPVLDDFGKPLIEGGKPVRRENDEQLAYVKVMADLVHRNARIMGVEQPIALVAPTQEQYIAQMRLLTQGLKATGAAEADPFSEEYLDAEVVEPEAGELDAGA